ncbi:hypothetical protein PAHAL_2G028300 [Panicum hallii]|uniref:Uncharacterized protein n=1 Tax=Panicum hallii TaxID=206008 RepID=A0A2T8KMM2_9POAL|nr:hypothetical protein PAHAL_2G028300 [Panicum hallii]
MSEPFLNWLGMGATIPARIQPGSIDHVPFPTVVPCLGASFFGFTIKPAGKIKPARPDAAPFRIIIYRPFFPPVPSRMKIVVCMFDFGCRCNRIGGSILWQDQSPGQTNPPPRRIVLCPPPDIPIERKSCLVIPRLQHVRSLTPR